MGVKVRDCMTVEISLELQAAIKLRAKKNHCRTGDVVAAAIRHTFPNDLKDVSAVMDAEEEAKDAG